MPPAQKRKWRYNHSHHVIREAPSRQAVTLRTLSAPFAREIVATQAPRQQDETIRELGLWRRFLGPRFVVARLGAREWHTFIRQRQTGEIDARGRPVARVQARRPVRARTVAKWLKVLRQACRFGTHSRARDGGFLLEADPTRGLPLPVERNPRRPVADSARVARPLAVADRVRMAAAGGALARSYLRELLVLAAGPGRRIGAILALRWSDWHPDARPYGTLHWRARHDKARRDWWTPVRPEVRDALEQLQRERGGNGEALLFPSAHDPARPISRALATRWLQRAERLAQLVPLPGGAWHPFRRGWATSRKHLSLRDVAEAGGWQDTATLVRCYQRPDLAALVEVVLGGRPFRAMEF
jgi:integrase